MLRPRFDAHGGTWKMRHVRAEIQLVDPGALGIAGAVLRKLKGSDAISPELETELIQGLAAEARARGYGVVLHTTNAIGVREHIIELTRKRFYAMARKTGDTRARFTASSIASVLDSVQEQRGDADGNLVDIEYLVGWTLIPPNMMAGGWLNFMPVSAIDAAGMRGRGQGVMIVRATKDANNNIHPVSISHMLAAESDRSIGAHVAAELKFLDLHRDGVHVPIVDGGASLKKFSGSHWRCTRHLQDELSKKGRAGKADLEIYNKITRLPKNHVRLVDQLYKTLPEDSSLRELPMETFCQPHMSEGAYVMSYHALLKALTLCFPFV